MVVFLAIDFVWLTQIAGPYYFELLGDLMRDDVRYDIAGAFYALYVLGIVHFCIIPALERGGVRRAAVDGAFLGVIAYATYELTNLATLKGWPIELAITDIIWGGVLTSACATIGFLLTRRFRGG